MVDRRRGESGKINAASNADLIFYLTLDLYL